MEATIATTPKKPTTKKPAAKKPAAKKAAKPALKTVKTAAPKKAATPKKAAAPAKAVKPAAPKTAGQKAALKPVPAKPTPAKTGSKVSKEVTALHDMILNALDQDKGDNIVSIDLSNKTALADYMVIVTGTSSRHVVGMAEKLKDRLSKQGIRARIEGKDTGDWVIVDAGDVIVHLFRAEVRTFYNLEKLWSTDFSTTDYTLYKSV